MKLMNNIKNKLNSKISWQISLYQTHTMYHFCLDLLFFFFPSFQSHPHYVHKFSPIFFFLNLSSFELIIRGRLIIEKKCLFHTHSTHTYHFCTKIIIWSYNFQVENLTSSHNFSVSVYNRHFSFKKCFVHFINHNIPIQRF